MDKIKLIEWLRNNASFSIEALPEDVPLKGQIMASGDDEADRAAELAIEKELEWNPWAWALVKVTASYLNWHGVNYLGGCSYEDEEDFKKGGYYFDMINMALNSLADEILRDNAALDILELNLS